MHNLPEAPPISLPPTLTVDYRLTFRDVFIAHAISMTWLMFGVFIVFLVFDVSHRWSNPDNLSAETLVIEFVLFAFVFAVICFLTALTLAFLWALLRWRRLVNIVCTASVLEYGYRDESPVSLHEIRWPAIVSIQWSVGRIIIRMIGGLTFIVPASAFESKNSACSFFYELHKRWKQGRKPDGKQ